MISKPIFIVGHPRSGTTMLATILNRHTQLCVTPETQFLIEQGGLEPRVAPEQFKRILLSSRVRDLDISVAEATRDFDATDQSRKAAFATILDVYRKKMKCKRVAEKSPLHLWHAETLLEWFPDAKIICIERDGRDVVESLMQMPWSHQNVVQHAYDWRKSIFEARRLVQKHERNILLVRYEDALLNPEKLTRLVCAFCGLDFESPMLQASNSAETIPQWERQWKSKAAGPVEIPKSKRRNMNLMQVLVFESIVADAKRAAHYKVRLVNRLFHYLVHPLTFAYHPKIKPYFQRAKAFIRGKK